jgi:beta-xylosidase
MLLLPLLRRGTGALAVAAAFFACEGDPNNSTAPPPAPALNQPVSFSHLSNPVHAGDFADPFVLVADSMYYAYATNHASSHVPMLRSADLVTWTPVGDAMPSLPSWAESGRRLTWAPAVVGVDQHYVLFYTTRDHRSGLQCIGRAEALTATGPFHDQSSTPFICQFDLGGSIDASVVADSTGQLFLLWKNDGNCCGKPVTIWSQRLSADGRALLGEPAALLERDQLWEGSLIEAPSMWQENGTWHILYSANMWNTDQYAIGYGVCDSPVGPCRKVGQGPVMVSNDETAGPGGAEVFSDREGQRWIAYHGWNPSRVGYRQGGSRSLRLDRVKLAPADLAVKQP